MIKVYWISTGSARIKTVQADRQTDSSVWINGRRHAKRSNWDNYYSTWDVAKRHIVSKATHKVTAYRARLAEATAHLKKVIDLKP
jgi:hypothetical protein